MQERFKQLLEEKNLTATRFAAMIKVNASAMSHILNGRSKPGFDVLDKIAQAFPDVNLNWLISGKGSLYNNRISTPAKEVEKIPVQKNLFEEEEKRF
ncbi:helix-turn-helix domain-containing protein, partial [Odoribacter splanchnicus]